MTYENLYNQAAVSAGNYVKKNSGATARIMKEID
jgi:hypothetical protein